jgi:hypothetical protein
LRGEDGRRSQGWANAGAPDRTEQQSDAELSAKAMRSNSADPLIRPITDRAARDRQTNLQCWHCQHEANANHQDGGGGPEYITIEPDREADRGDKQTNSDEGQRNSARQD